MSVSKFLDWKFHMDKRLPEEHALDIARAFKASGCVDEFKKEYEFWKTINGIKL